MKTEEEGKDIKAAKASAHAARFSHQLGSTLGGQGVVNLRSKET